MKILIAGGNSQLAKEIKYILDRGSSSLGDIDSRIIQGEVISLSREELDITDLNMVKKVVNNIKPDVIINCAAYTNVDGCESDFKGAFQVNALGPRNLAIAAKEANSKLLHISTDYVFEGEGTSPYKEYDRVNPKSIYGKTKALGDDYVRELCDKYFIVRTSWLYGRFGKNFVYTISNLGDKNDSIKVVNDQLGNPTNCEDLAYNILKLIVTEEYGIYHCTGEGICSWYDFAVEIIKLKGCHCKVEPCTTEEYPRPAKRPTYSALDNLMLECTIGNTMRDWKEALKDFFQSHINDKKEV
jgi:dTDP-4-dehydrorhamnose reductase